VTITGFAAPSATGKRIKYLQAVGATTVVLSNDSVNSSANNRILVRLTADTFTTNGGLTMVYASSRWRVVGAAGAT